LDIDILECNYELNELSYDKAKGQLVSFMNRYSYLLSN